MDFEIPSIFEAISLKLNKIFQDKLLNANMFALNMLFEHDLMNVQMVKQIDDHIVQLQVEDVKYFDQILNSLFQTYLKVQKIYQQSFEIFYD